MYLGLYLAFTIDTGSLHVHVTLSLATAGDCTCMHSLLAVHHRARVVCMYSTVDEHVNNMTNVRMSNDSNVTDF
jgi:hypothetical protein